MTTAPEEEERSRAHWEKMLHGVLDSRIPKLASLVRKEVDQSTEKIKRTLYGNGNDGLTIRVAVLERETTTRLDAIETGVSQIQNALIHPVRQTNGSQRTVRTALIVVAVIAALFVAGYGMNRINAKLPGVAVEQADDVNPP